MSLGSGAGPDGCVLGGSDRTGLLSRTDGVDVLLDWFERRSEHYSSLLSYLILCFFLFFLQRCREMIGVVV